MWAVTCRQDSSCRVVTNSCVTEKIVDFVQYLMDFVQSLHSLVIISKL